MSRAALAYLPKPASPRPAEARPRTRHIGTSLFSRQLRLHPKPRQGVKNRTGRNAPGLTLKTHANAPGITPVAAETVVGCSVAAERGGAARQILLNRVREAGSLSEAKGIVYGTRQMERLGYTLEDASLSYGSNQGLDLAFSNGSNYAILEAKHAGGLNRLITYGGLRQGSNAYNISRLERYLRLGDGANDALARTLLRDANAGTLESFTSSYRAGKIQQLPLGWPDPAFPPVVR